MIQLNDSKQIKIKSMKKKINYHFKGNPIPLTTTGATG